MNSPAGNMPLSVTELTAGIKTLLERNYAAIEVRGEVSGLRRQASGHIYFTIKDAHAAISAVIWKSTALRLKLLPEEGKEFIFAGSISVYEPRGTYQLVVRRIEALGTGELAAEFERRKKLFAERGWFETARKKAPPPLPRHIGIITSPTAAAFEDVKKVLATRPAWLELTLAPAVVQGDGAPASIESAVQHLNDMEKRPDVILLVRGGGSIEDLWCFNDERVVKAIVDSSIPVITGIGHEIDTTLADFAADIRAATPSNAAELVCPERESLRGRVTKIHQLQYLWQRQQDSRHQHSERHAIRLSATFQQRLAMHHRQLNVLKQRLSEVEPRRQLRKRQQVLSHCQQHLAAFAMHGFEKRRNRSAALGDRLHWLGPRLIEGWRQGTLRLQKQLQSLGPMQVLERGYTLTTDNLGRPITSVKGLKRGDSVRLMFRDGRADADITSTGEKST